MTSSDRAPSSRRQFPIVADTGQYSTIQEDAQVTSTTRDRCPKRRKRAIATSVEFQTDTRPAAAELVSLYNSVGWTAYTKDPESLERAVRNTTWFVAAREGDRLVGLLRTVSDDVSICYIQDILVDPAFQRRGIGRRLVQRCLERFDHVRQKVLLTDDRPGQKRFYESLGFQNIRSIESVQLNAFVRLENLAK